MYMCTYHTSDYTVQVKKETTVLTDTEGVPVTTVLDSIRCS